MAKASVIGAGSWGTALALLLSKNGHDVTMWSILEDEIRMLDKEREHKSKLPGVKLPDAMKFTTDLKEAVEGKDFLVLAVPSTFTRGTAKNMCPYVAEGQIIVDVAKGIEEATLMTLSQQIEQEIPQADVAVLSGSRTRTSDNGCCRGKDRKDCQVPAGDVCERGISRIYKSGYAWYGAWRFA